MLENMILPLTLPQQYTVAIRVYQCSRQNNIIRFCDARKGKGQEMDTMANSYASTSHYIGILRALTTDMTHANWIIDTGASNHMVHNFSLISQSTHLDVKSNMKVNLPTGDQNTHRTTTTQEKRRHAHTVFSAHENLDIHDLKHNLIAKNKMDRVYLSRSSEMRLRTEER
ncbi:hypothetical protein H5410_062804 [Solanum commersonii]|uniref:Uncharacterized protein n=1 Tax=Solanum commersonii TaxID=4109 RepID=A0A9J5WDS8_SOLCO|nr:hypothetical protein H5410_062804 [Solanum commersonii]